MHGLNHGVKKAAAGGQAARGKLQNIRYNGIIGSATNFSPQNRKIPRRHANRFEDRRQELIGGLLAASTPKEREAIHRSLAEGKKLRKAVEGFCDNGESTN
jgi:hypothetical protein